ncbi:MAG: hypothetical protein QM589_16695 [Thermomicrobiales bacterium]
MSSLFPSTDSARHVAETTTTSTNQQAGELHDDTRSPFVQALPMLLSIAVTLALTLAFVTGQWLANGSSILT